MPEPQADPNLGKIQRVARHALAAGAAIMLLKFGVFAITNSVAVLSDAMESIINVAAAAVMLYTIWYSNRPADSEHPYGHGKIEAMAVGLEGWLILIAGLVIGVEAIRRLITGTAPQELNLGIWLLAGVGVLDAALAVYVWRAGRRYHNATLIADGKHLMTDVASTVGVLAGLGLVQWTGRAWVDPLVAIVMASLIFFASWRLLWESFHGLMDTSDPADEQAILEILDEEVAQGTIHGYHKVRHRHSGPFHWVDMHLQVDGSISVRQGHELASRIEHRIEQRLGRANATAHLEPSDATTPAPPLKE
ncbi:MAG TPA: cation diffusion facilitator family transporter [Phycisphaeraceae bacterium]